VSESERMASLEARITELEGTVRAMKALAKGDPGRDGRDGRDGKSVSLAQIAALLKTHAAPRAPQPIMLEPTFNVPVPTVNVRAGDVIVPESHINVAVPQQAAPVININVPKPKPRHVRFDADRDGNITGAVLTNE
jgi:hypothetical protein